MIRELAQVSAIHQGKVTVSAAIKSGCQGCAQKRTCGAGILADVFADRHAEFDVSTSQTLQVGQQVELLIPDHLITRFSLLLYVVPLLILILTSVLLSVSAASEGLTIVVALGLFLGSFSVLKWYFKRRDVKLQQSVEIHPL